MAIAGVWLLSVLLAQDAPAIRASMRGSLHQQQKSVWRQTHAAALASAQRLPIRVPAEHSACAPADPDLLHSWVAAAAQEHGVSSALVTEVARAESAFRPCSVSLKGAQGIMQLMPATQVALGVGDPFDARQSIGAGTRLLGQLLERYQGDVALALSAYNAGTGLVDRTGGLPRNTETRNYVARILGRYARSRDLRQEPLLPMKSPNSFLRPRR